MPVELFMEIAPYVDPGDLVSLVRTSKFFRAMLLEQSAAPIWQCSLSNVPDLPPCPTGMVEPQYAALIFTKNCMICSSQVATSKPDPYLRVRLCPSCRSTELVERIPYYRMPINVVPFTWHIKNIKNSSSRKVMYQLRAQVQEFERTRSEFNRNGDKEGLAMWDQQQEAVWDIQYKEGDALLKFINSTTLSRSTELKDLKTERQEQIHKRLKALGWEEKYFAFSGGSNNARKQWHSLVEAPKPLTERNWTNMLPKLRQLLEENRPQVEEHEQRQRQAERCSKVEALLCDFKKDTDPYRFIVGALQQPSTTAGNMNNVNQTLIFWAPFPCSTIFNGWNLVSNMYKEENTLEKVQELFDEQRDMIDQKLLGWRTKVEDQLVKQYTSSFAEDTNSRLNTVLTVKGSTDATKNLSDDARFLLRADTVFMASNSVIAYTEADQEHGPVTRSVHFPQIYWLSNTPFLYESSYRDDPDKEAEELGPYVRHAGKEAIVKALLRELDMPNVTHIELKHMGEVFVCGRCNRSQAMGWLDIVEHYHLKRRDWIGGKFVYNNFTTRHPVVFRNMHDLAPGMSFQPLIRIGNDTCVGSVALCLICRGIERCERFESLRKMREHMVEVHDAMEPTEKLHFITQSNVFDALYGLMAPLAARANWEKKWDGYHDARDAVNEATQA